MQGDFFDNSIGDWFVSDEQKKLNESALKDAELQRQQTQILIDQLAQKKAMSSGDNATDNKKYLILGGMAIMMVFALLIIK